MAQPGVAREPSMEEILASIRRIIENNEPDPAAMSSGAQSGMHAFDLADEDMDAGTDAESAEDIHLTIEDQLPKFGSAPAPVEERRAPQQTAAPSAFSAIPQTGSEPAARREVEPRSISLADVAARVRAASERVPVEPMRGSQGEPAQASQRPVELRPTPTAAPMPVRASEPVARAPLSAAEGAPMRAASEPDRRPNLFGQDDGGHQPVPHQGFAPTAPRSAEAELASLAANDRTEQQEPAPRLIETVANPRFIEAYEPEPVAENDTDGKALVSAETGMQVARSFDELADMVQSTAKRSLDEVAEDLLRPMLQEWLDDNLPTLVERLVREEIERVARGPRR